MSFKGAVSTLVTALPNSSFMALKRIIEVIHILWTFTK
jgi:hypothetical protein